MSELTFPTAIAFEGCDRGMAKEQAIDVLEEAAELMEAVKAFLRTRGELTYRNYHYFANHRQEDGWPISRETLIDCAAMERAVVLDEAMDVYQSLANLLAGEFSDAEIADAYRRCVERNRDRGRYGRG